MGKVIFTADETRVITALIMAGIVTPDWPVNNWLIMEKDKKFLKSVALKIGISEEELSKG